VAGDDLTVQERQPLQLVQPELSWIHDTGVAEHRTVVRSVGGAGEYPPEAGAASRPQRFGGKPLLSLESQ
jgi:hypothetical protein